MSLGKWRSNHTGSDGINSYKFNNETLTDLQNFSESRLKCWISGGHHLVKNYWHCLWELNYFQGQCCNMMVYHHSFLLFKLIFLEYNCYTMFSFYYTVSTICSIYSTIVSTIYSIHHSALKVEFPVTCQAPLSVEFSR